MIGWMIIVIYLDFCLDLVQSLMIEAPNEVIY